MNNSKEFTDESKPLDPSVLDKVNTVEAPGNPVSDEIKGKSSDAPNNFDAVDFTCYKGLRENAKWFERVQDVSNIVLNGFRVPFCSGDFRPITIPKSRAGVPVVPYNYYITRNGVTGGGSTFFSSGWMTSNEEYYFQDFILDGEKFEVKMDEKTKTKLMTLVTIWSNEYLDKGIRDSRARPNVVLGDWSWALTPTWSNDVRAIRTDLVAAWQYGSYTPTTPASTFIIINASDLRTFLNTGGGNYWPVEMNTPCLALGKTPTTNLPKLAVLASGVFIDFDSSMTAARGTLVSHNGCPAYEVSCTLSVNANDFDVAQILNNTFSSTDLQWAVFANTLPLPSRSGSCVFHLGNFSLRVYENTICDQFINFYATHRDTGNKLPTDAQSLLDFIQAWRLYKTAFTQRSIVELGLVGQQFSTQTYGKSITADNYFELMGGCFEVDPSYSPGTFFANLDNTVLWICYEMWICNGAKLTLDEEDYVDGMTGVFTNCNYLVPRSQVLLSPTTWSNGSASHSSAEARYYRPNASAASTVNTYSTGYATAVASCVPSTVPNVSSTTETMTLQWDKSQTIDFSYSSVGKNKNTVFRKKMVFK